jgi:hypothetical protein
MSIFIEVNTDAAQTLFNLKAQTSSPVVVSAIQQQVVI